MVIAGYDYLSQRNPHYILRFLHYMVQLYPFFYFDQTSSVLLQPCEISFFHISLASSNLNSSRLWSNGGSLPKTLTIFCLLVLESNWQYELTRRLLHYRIFCLVLRFQLLSPYLSFFARSILVFLGLSLPCISFFFLLYPRLITLKQSFQY